MQFWKKKKKNQIKKETESVKQRCIESLLTHEAIVFTLYLGFYYTSLVLAKLILKKPEILKGINNTILNRTIHIKKAQNQ